MGTSISERIRIRCRLLDAGLVPISGTTFQETSEGNGRFYTVCVPDGTARAFVVADWRPSSIVWFGDIDRPRVVEMGLSGEADYSFSDETLPPFDEEEFTSAALEAQRWQREVPS